MAWGKTTDNGDDEPAEVVREPFGPLPRGGHVRPMTRWGTPVMHRPQQQVTVFDERARPDFAAVEGLGLDGQPVRFEGDGLLAKCLQHEADHTGGIVFGDRLSARSMKKLRKQHEAAADEYPTEWPT